MLEHGYAISSPSEPGGPGELINGQRRPSTVHNYPVLINQAYIDTFNQIGCEQMVNFPTRINNILDVFCTNRPSLVDRCAPIPGFSDHDIVLADTNILPARQKPV